MMLRIMVVQRMRRDGHSERGTQFHPKRRAAGGHETNGDIGTKQQRGQHDDGRYMKPALKTPCTHSSLAQRCRSTRDFTRGKPNTQDLMVSGAKASRAR